MDNTHVQETITQGDVLLHHICKILNTNSWIIPEGIKTSAAAKKSGISIKRIHSHYKEMEIVKGYLHYKTITSQTVLSVAHIKNFFISLKSYVPFSRYSSFCNFNHPMIYQICDVMSISI